MTVATGGAGHRERLTRNALQRSRPELAEPLPGSEVGVGIVHLGTGAFHRAHQAVLTQQAMLAEPGPWAICGVSQRSRTVLDQLGPQGGLYTVAERNPAADRLRVVGAVRELLLATEEPDRLTSLLARPTTHIVSITVTEAGYRHDPRTGRLREDDPELLADLAGRPPRTVVGQLVRGLRARRAAGDDAGLTVLCCDNLPDNGALVRELVHDFCARLPDGDADPLRGWVDDHVAFPSSVVDQIVPATTGADLAAVADALGLVDLGAVVGEPYRQWTIENHFAGPRPAWERAGVRFVDGIAPYQAHKLRLVNGGHSALAYLGLLAGFGTVAEAVGNDAARAFLQALVAEELGPSLARFGDAAQPAEVRGLLERFANPRIEHRLTQIAAHGPRKLPQRLLEPAAELLSAGREPRLICLVLAGWLRFLQGQADGGHPLPVLDGDSAALRAAVAPAEEPRRAAEALLRAWSSCPEPLRESPVFCDLLTEWLARLRAGGVLATLRKLSAGGQR